MQNGDLSNGKKKRNPANADDIAHIFENTVFKFCCIIDQYDKNEFTIKELAPLFGVTTSTLNRIIDKFETKGYCKIIGKLIIRSSERPGRIIHFNFG